MWSSRVRCQVTACTAILLLVATVAMPASAAESLLGIMPPVDDYRGLPERVGEETIAVTGQRFTQARRITISVVGEKVERVMIAIPLEKPVKAGDLVTLTCWLRLTPLAADGKISFLGWFHRRGEVPPILDVTSPSATADWRECTMTGVMPMDLDQQTGVVSLMFGDRPQVVDLGPVTLTRVKKARR